MIAAVVVVVLAAPHEADSADVAVVVVEDLAIAEDSVVVAEAVALPAVHPEAVRSPSNGHRDRSY